MSIVQGELQGSRVLDLFAGSGALGLEALSRGAVQATFVEEAPRTLRILRDNIDALGAGPRSRIVRGDAVRFAADLPGLAFDVAFADPPYATPFAEAIARQWLATPFARVLGVEHGVRDALPPGDTRKYGDSAITFYRL
jgi:16S rRNA (guanine966-N2)-methyltransferase